METFPGTLVRRLASRTRLFPGDAGFTLIELIGVMVMLIIILTAVTALFVSGTRAQVDLNERFTAQTEARVATDKLRQEVHCASAVTASTGSSVTISLPSTCPTAGGVATTVVYDTSNVSTSRFELRRNGSRIADYLTSGDVFTFIPPSADSLGKLRLDLPVNVDPSEPWKQWRLRTDVVLRNTTRS